MLPKFKLFRSYLRTLTITSDVVLLGESFLDALPTDERLKNVRIIVVNVPCSKSGVVNPVDFVLQEGIATSIKELARGKTDSSKVCRCLFLLYSNLWKFSEQATQMSQSKRERTTCSQSRVLEFKAGFHMIADDRGSQIADRRKFCDRLRSDGNTLLRSVAILRS